MCAHTETDRCIINYSQRKKTEKDTYRNRFTSRNSQRKETDRQRQRYASRYRHNQMHKHILSRKETETDETRETNRRMQIQIRKKER